VTQYGMKTLEKWIWNCEAFQYYSNAMWIRAIQDPSGRHCILQISILCQGLHDAFWSWENVLWALFHCLL